MKNTINTFRKSAALIVLLVLLLPAAALTQDKKNFLWEVRSKTGTVYILGSIHFMKQDAYPLSKPIEEAFQRSKMLAVEANITDPSAVNIFSLAEKAIYTGDDSLEKHISRETMELLEKELRLLSLPREFIYKQKPWFLAMTIESLGLMKAGYSPVHGIDYHFLSRSGSKQVIELEGVDFQVILFSELADDEQEAMLLHTLKEQKDSPRQVDEIVGAWTRGDAVAMDKILLRSIQNDSSMSSLYEKFLYRRNRNMASKIEDFLKKGESVFVVVGAGHLVGDRGIIAILKGQGYSIRQL